MAEKTPPSSSALSPREQRLQSVTRKARRLGYIVFFGTAVLVFLPITIGAISGLRDGRVWDPFTGQQVSARAEDPDCRRDATSLLMEAGRLNALSASWENRHRRWVTRCKGEEPVAFSMLRSARGELRRGESGSASSVEEDVD
ncbi:hypothetical protein FRC96_10150 [Lujinxingia vulgaris]|uniref:Uncharacterized protein n=1 Tax=Lujinxingia vulgaris TaxID=2600176 RepID=A0A5C6XE85_9DELT|nr:hypothetical protein [Lujinxingia vulgaris]TXD36432.1 hypothetical protein FRC96_10150 [Lujinxingia vulgaris]